MALYRENRPAEQVDKIRYSLAAGARRLADYLSKTPASPIAGPAADAWYRSMMVILERGPAEYIRYAASRAFSDISYAIQLGKVPNAYQVEKRALDLMRKAHEAPMRDARLAKDALQRLSTRLRKYTY